MSSPFGWSGSAKVATCESKLVDSSPCTTGDESANGICLDQSNICVSQIILAPSEPFCVQAR